MTIKEKLLNVSIILDESCPKEIKFLKEEIAWRFVLLVILTARCTDKKVMSIKDSLFSAFPKLEDFKEENREKLEAIIKPLGLYKNKAENLIGCAKSLREDFQGIVPDNIEALLKLKGVGRKCANCILGEVFHKPAIICDTHFIRFNYRLGITKKKDALETERVVGKNLKDSLWYRYSMTANYYAREICKSQRPLCEKCSLRSFCSFT